MVRLGDPNHPSHPAHPGHAQRPGHQGRPDLPGHVYNMDIFYDLDELGGQRDW